MTEDQAQALLAEDHALRAENASLRARLAELQWGLTSAQNLVTALQSRVRELEHLKTPPPSFVRPNKPPPSADKPPCHKRDARYYHGRRSATPTETRTVAYEHYPDCGYALGGKSIARRRELIDLLSS